MGAQFPLRAPSVSPFSPPLPPRSEAPVQNPEVRYSPTSSSTVYKVIRKYCTCKVDRTRSRVSRSITPRTSSTLGLRMVNYKRMNAVDDDETIAMAIAKVEREREKQTGEIGWMLKNSSSDPKFAKDFADIHSEIQIKNINIIEYKRKNKIKCNRAHLEIAW